MPNPQRTTFQYNTSREEANAQAVSRSTIGKGIAGDSETLRESVVAGVKATLMKRMEAANTASKEEALQLFFDVGKKTAYYNTELSAIRSDEIKKQELTEQISRQKAEKSNLRNSDAYQAHRTYRAKKKALSREEEMRQKQQGLSGRQAYADAHAKALVNLRNLMESPVKGSKKDRKQTEELYTQGLKDWENEQAELTADRLAIHDYKGASSEHLTEEYYQNTIAEHAAAKEQYKNTRKQYKSDRKKVLELTQKIRESSDKVKSIEKEQSERKSALLDTAITDHADLTKKITEHQAKSLAHSIRHDKAAIQYYVLMRGNDADSAQNARITGHTKDISKYVGRPATPYVLAHYLENIKQKPGEEHAVQITDLTDSAHPADTRHISHDRLIALTQGDTTYHMDSEYNVTSNASSGAAGGSSPTAGAAPVKLKDLKASDGSALSINETDAGGRYAVMGNALAIETIATGRIGHKEELNGLWIDGEFIPANGPQYESPADARRSYQKKMQEGGAFDRDKALALAIRNSKFFSHIYAENVEFYSRYPGDDDDIAAVDLNTPASSNSAGSPDLAALKSAFKVTDEDHKAMILFEQRGPGGHFSSLIGDTGNFADSTQKERVIAKLVHAMLVSNNDRENAVKIAKDHGNSILSASTENASAQNFGLLLCACETVIHNSKTSRFTAALMRGWSAAEDFADGDGPLKGTIAEGLINYDQLNEYYEGLNTACGFISGKIEQIHDLEKEMEGLDESSDDYKSLSNRKDDLENDLEHGTAGNVVGVINSLKDFIFSCINIGRMIKEKRFLSDEHASEKDLGSLYVGVFDYLFDIGNTLLAPLDALLGLLTNDSVGVKSAKPVAEIVGIIKDMFHTLESGYHLFQDSRKVHNISKAMDTITSNRLVENGTTVDLSKASEENPQVIYLLGRTRNKAGKDIADDSIDVATGIANSTGHFTGTIGSKIISLSTTAVSTLGKLITNGIYQGNEKTAALKAAFNEKYSTYRKNSNFDRILKMTAGINSLKHLAVVSRIFAAIDTHYMLKEADANSSAFKLAKTAMSAFYRPKPAANGKDGFDNLPLSAILGHVGEGDNWRSKLVAAVR